MKLELLSLTKHEESSALIHFLEVLYANREKEHDRTEQHEWEKHPRSCISLT